MTDLERRNLVHYLIALALFLLFFFYISPKLIEHGSGCYMHDEIYNQECKSKVIRKFIDGKNHNFYTIVFLDTNNKEEKIILDEQFENMYDSILVGDSLFKLKGALSYKVKVFKTGTIKSFKFHSFCKDSLKLTRQVKQP